MSFGLTPQEHLDYFNKEQAAFRSNLTSVRLAVNCCTWMNHLTEIIFSNYSVPNPSKVYSMTKLEEYRAQLISRCSDLGLIRDLCDYAKHGPNLHRASVVVKSTTGATTYELTAAGFLLGTFHHDRVDRLVVTLKDNSEQWLDAIVWRASEFWKAEFQAQAL